MKLALKAVAKLADTTITEATKTTRRHPLFDEEIKLEEELINLEESFSSYRLAGETLLRYPKLRRYVIREQQVILKHCIGQIARMMRGRRMHEQYSDKDITYALTKLIRVLVSEATLVNKKIDEEVMEIIKPFLSLRQRIIFREWQSFSVSIYWLALKRRMLGLRQLG